jgi:hypothetical protein
MKATGRQRNILFAVALALNAILLLWLPRMGMSTGRVERDLLPLALASLVAAVTIWPCIRLIRIGEPWQQVLGLTLLVLPSWILFSVASWAVSRW